MSAPAISVVCCLTVFVSTTRLTSTLCVTHHGSLRLLSREKKGAQTDLVPRVPSYTCVCVCASDVEVFVHTESLTYACVQSMLSDNS